jgi:hypothetical protein
MYSAIAREAAARVSQAWRVDELVFDRREEALADGIIPF